MIIFNLNILNRNIRTGENSKPTNSRFFDCESFEFSVWNSVENDWNASNFTDKNSLIGNEIETTLWKSYRLITIKSFKSGKTNLAFFFLNSPEEMLKSIINSFGDILFNLTMDRNIKIFCEFIQIKLGEISLISFVSINFGFKKFVVDETAIRNMLIQFDNLLLRRIYSVSKIHLSKHQLFNKLNYLNLTELNLGGENSSNH